MGRMESTYMVLMSLAIEAAACGRRSSWRITTARAPPPDRGKKGVP